MRFATARLVARGTRTPPPSLPQLGGGAVAREVDRLAKQNLCTLCDSKLHTATDTMSDIAIQVENLSKRYRIGRQEERPETLVGAALGWLKAPVDNFRQLRQLSRFQENGQEPDDIIWALKDVSFEVKRGEVVGIIGRNGAGKSTLLKILSRITEPTSGRVVLNGRVSSLLEVGTGFHPDLTGRENVYLNGAILGMTKREIDRKFDEIVDFSGVERFIDTPVKRYSSGMQVRLAFAVAAHLEPEILLVDEVLAVGDAAFQKKCLGKMGEVAKEGRTVLFVSHDMAAVQTLCSLALYLKSGRTAIYSEVKQVIETYINVINSEPTRLPDLSRRPRNKGNTNTIRISKCTVLNSEYEKSDTLLLGEPFSISLEVITQEFYRDLAVVIGIDSMLRTRITTVKSDSKGNLFDVSPGSVLEIVAHFPDLELYPGDYLITLSIRTGKIPLDTLWYVQKFRVSELAYKNKRPHNDSWGLVRTNVDWQQL